MGTSFDISTLVPMEISVINDYRETKGSKSSDFILSADYNVDDGTSSLTLCGDAAHSKESK